MLENLFNSFFFFFLFAAVTFGFLLLKNKESFSFFSSLNLNLDIFFFGSENLKKLFLLVFVLILMQQLIQRALVMLDIAFVGIVYLIVVAEDSNKLFVVCVSFSRAVYRTLSYFCCHCCCYYYYFLTTMDLELCQVYQLVVLQPIAYL